MALPALSVATTEEAQRLRVLSCKLTYDDPPRYKIMEDSGFKTGDLFSLYRASDWLERMYHERIVNQTTTAESSGA